MTDGNVVVITGASSGFGRLTAETLARKRYRVFATMRDMATRNARVADEIRGLAARESLFLRPVEIDVTEDASVERGVKEIITASGRIDVLVNNAGYGMVDLAESVTTAQAQRISTRTSSAPCE